MQFLYGDSWEHYPIKDGEVWGLADGSRVAVHDIYDPLPTWMRADLLFVDPPWNLGNLNSFCTKAGVPHRRDFGGFADILFQRVSEIGPRTAYIEIGNQAVEDWMERLAVRFSCVQRWPVVYYSHHPTNLLRGSFDDPQPFDFKGMDEARCIRILTEIECYGTIADPCMGRGLVGMAAYRARKRFVGTELNKRRLAVLLNRLARAGAMPARVE